MPFLDIASFPSARIKPSNSTNRSIIGNLNFTANTAAEARPAAQDRTVCSLGNTSSNAQIRYKRGNGTNIDTEGYVLEAGQAVDLYGPESIWVYPEGVDVIIQWDDGRG